MNLCYLRHCWVGLIDVWPIEWCLSIGLKRWWFDSFTYWLICVYMIVQQIDHLFLHISLRRIYSSSFLLCNKVSYLDLHSKCLKMDWYLTLLFLLSFFGQLQSLFYHTTSLSIHLLIGQLHHSWRMCTTN